MKTAIVVKNAGHMISEDHLKKMFDGLKPACLGVAATAMEGDKPLIVLEHIPDLTEIGDEAAIMEKIKEFQDTLQEVQAIFQFSTSPGKVATGADGLLDTSYMQPFPLLFDGEGNIRILGCLSGDFPGFVKEGSEHPSEFFAVQEEIIPRLQQLLELANGDYDKMVNTIAKNVMFHKDLKKLSSGDNGLILLLGSNGQLLSLPKKDGLTTNHPWGWSSFAEVAGGASAEPEKKSLFSKFGNFGANRKTSVAVKQPDVKIEPKIEPPKNPEPVQPLPDKPTETAPIVTVEMVQCPPHITGKNNIRAYYEKNAGYCPVGYKNRPKVEKRVVLPDAKDLKQLDKVVEAAAVGKTKPIASTEPIRATARPTPPLVPQDIKAEMLADAVILKMVDKSSRTLPTLKELDEIEKKYPAFSEQFGEKITLSTFAKMTFDELKQFTAQYSAAADVLLQNLLWQYARTHQNEVEQPSGASTKTETQVTAKPAGKYSFGARKTA